MHNTPATTQSCKRWFLFATFLLGGSISSHSKVILQESFEGQPFSDGSPAGNWVRGSGAFSESYLAGGGILNRAAADLGTRAISLNPTPATSWLYRDTGQTFAPDTTYTLTLYAGSRQNSAYQQRGHPNSACGPEFQPLPRLKPRSLPNKSMATKATPASSQSRQW